MSLSITFPKILFFGTSIAKVLAIMHEKREQNTIERILQDFVQEVQQSDLSRQMMSIYEELGIEP